MEQILAILTPYLMAVSLEIDAGRTRPMCLIVSETDHDRNVTRVMPIIESLAKVAYHSLRTGFSRASSIANQTTLDDW